jgi:hypothetical protein
MKRKKARAAAPVVDMQKIVGDLAEALHRLVTAVAGAKPTPAAPAAPAVAKNVPAPAPKGPAPRRRASAPMTPAKKKALQLQAHYMVAIRSLSIPQKADVKKLREKKGVESAIRLAAKLAKKGPQK